jgi:hypothetical protein
MSARLMAVWVVVALSLAGPLQPLVLAQPPGPRAETREDPRRSELPAARTTDLYDVGAVGITVIGIPLKGLICAVSGGLALALLLATFGSAHRATAGVIEEGCGQKWIVRGDDIRPDLPGSRAFEWESARRSDSR